jgi:hypothetical protein
MSDPFRSAVGEYADRIGVPEPSDQEMDDLLALAKAASEDSGDRRSAPITCYLAGLAVAGEPSAQARRARIVELTQTLARGRRQGSADG